MKRMNKVVAKNKIHDMILVDEKTGCQIFEMLKDCIVKTIEETNVFKVSNVKFNVKLLKDSSFKISFESAVFI